MSSGKPKAVGNTHFFVPCQIDVVNKQLVSTLLKQPASRNSKLVESHILIY